MLRMDYLQRYDNDPAFCAALEELHTRTVGSAPPLDPEYVTWVKALPDGPRTHVGAPSANFPWPSGSEAYHRYRLAVDGFVVEWGLDRLEGSPFEGVPDGGDYVNDWCMLRQRWPDSAPASEFSVSRGWGETPVILNTAVAVEITGAWDPRRERQRDAQRRLESLAGEAIRARLEDIASSAERAGLHFSDAAPARKRDLDWIFLLSTHRTTIADLASAKRESEDTVARAVSRMARRLRVHTDGWYMTGRTSRPDR